MVCLLAPRLSLYGLSVHSHTDVHDAVRRLVVHRSSTYERVNNVLNLPLPYFQNTFPVPGAQF